MTQRISLALLVAASLSFGSACTDETLSPSIAFMELIPQPVERQVELEEPPGIHLGQIPLFGQGTASFRLENISRAKVSISEITFDPASGGNYTFELRDKDDILFQDFPDTPAEFRVSETGTLNVFFEPTSDGTEGRAVVNLQTNVGTDGGVLQGQVVGDGVFVGEPNLQISYGGFTYDLPDDCTMNAGACVLPTLGYGNVGLGESASQQLLLRNFPTDGCRLPDLPSGGPDCSPVCVVRFDRGTRDMGLGFLPDNTLFHLEGSASLPFDLGPANPICDGQGSLVRGQLPLIVTAEAPSTEGPMAGTMVIESNDPGAQLIEIPLSATSRDAPVAVAKLRDCATFAPPCSDPMAIRPLERVYLDGNDSFDPGGGSIEDHEWRIIFKPAEADPALLDEMGFDTAAASMWLPLVGRYVLRLRVRNDQGVWSGVSATSDVEFHAVPSSRMHVQLVWDHPTNDQDLHVVYADAADLVYHQQFDCFWKNCRPSCTVDNDCDPAWWDTGIAPFEGPNPRLDIDDTNGLGPENVNVDEPTPGTYRVYVHYYGLVDIDDAPTRVTVRVFIDGIPHEFSRTLFRNDLWAVAQVVWNMDGSTNVSPATPDGANVVGSVRQLNYLPYPDGFDFGPVF